jgi:hypothetical protein
MGIRKIPCGAVNQIPQTVTCTTAATLLELAPLKCVQKLMAELGVPRLTVFDKKKLSLLMPSPLFKCHRRGHKDVAMYQALC